MERQREEGEVEPEVAVQVQRAEGAQVETRPAHAEAVQAHQPRPVARAVFEHRRSGHPVLPVAEEPLGAGLFRARLVAVEPGHAREPEVARSPARGADAGGERGILVVGLRRLHPPPLFEELQGLGHLAVDPLQPRQVGAGCSGGDQPEGGGVDEDVAPHARGQTRSRARIERFLVHASVSGRTDRARASACPGRTPPSVRRARA